MVTYTAQKLSLSQSIDNHLWAARRMASFSQNQDQEREAIRIYKSITHEESMPKCDPSELKELNKKLDEQLAQCIHLFVKSTQTPSTEQDAKSTISEFLSNSKDVEKNFLGFEQRGEKFCFSYESGLKAAILFFRKHTPFAIYKNNRCHSPMRPYPFGIFGYFLDLGRHYNDSFWSGFLETAFYLAAQSPKITTANLSQEEIRPADHPNLHIRYKLLVLETMDSVKKNLNSNPASASYSRIDIICRTYDQLLKDSSRPNQHQNALFIQRGHNPITCMLNMIQKNHFLVAEILDPSNRCPYRKRLANDLLLFRSTGFKIHFDGQQPQVLENRRWYESLGFKYQHFYQAMMAYQRPIREKIGSSISGSMYAFPYIILSILIWILPNPQTWREEGRLNEFGYGCKGRERKIYSAKQLFAELSKKEPLHQSSIKAYLDNFTESASNQSSLVP